MNDLLWWEESLEMFNDWMNLRWMVWQEYSVPEKEKDNFGCISEAIWAELNGLS